MRDGQLDSSEQKGTALALEEARDFIAGMPWRHVRATPAGPANKPPDPHEYVIVDWCGVDEVEFGHFVLLIRSEGYKGRYSPPYDPGRVMVNDYLQIDDWIYWYIYPNMLNRQRAEHRQHEVIPAQESAVRVRRLGSAASDFGSADRLSRCGRQPKDS